MAEVIASSRNPDSAKYIEDEFDFPEWFTPPPNYFVEVDGVKVPFSIYAGCVGSGWSRHDVVGLIYHSMKEIHTFVTDAARKVIAVHMKHANRFHNRVFPSVATVAEEAPGRSRVNDGAMSPSSVEMALSDLRETEAIRPLVGDELVEGDGSHRAKDRGVKRQGRHPITHYDIAGYFLYLPPYVRQQLLAGAKKVWQRMMAEWNRRKSAKILALPNPPSIQEQFVSGQVSPSVNPDHLISNPTRHEKASHTGQALNEDLGPPGFAISGVGIGISREDPEPPTKSERTTTDPRNESPDQASGRRVPNPKNRALNKDKEDGIKTASAAALPVSISTKESYARRRLTPRQWEAYEALRSIGLGIIRTKERAVLDVPFEILQSDPRAYRKPAIDWAYELVEFYYWLQRHGRSVGPGFLYGTWQNWLDGTRDWGGFERELETLRKGGASSAMCRYRERLLAESAIHRQKAEEETRPTGGNPLSRPERVAVSAPVRGNLPLKGDHPGVELETLPEAERLALLETAKDLILNSMDGDKHRYAVTTRDLVKKRGTVAAPVQRLARELLTEQKGTADG